MTYAETLEFLFRMLPMYQRVGKVAYKKDLTNTLELLAALDNPHTHFKTVHIAGTNGKGTSAHSIAAILQTANYKTGLYTSPHLRNFTERIKINGVEVAQKFVIDFVSQTKDKIETIKPSFFEITVAMAFQYFRSQAIDIAVVETGLGGRLDSTNVLSPEVCLITNIGLDHTDMLGDSLEKIASEKAGIIKQGVPIVIGAKQNEVHHVFVEKAQAVGAELLVAESTTQLKHNNLPYYKKVNQAGILQTVNVLREKGYAITDDHITEGFDMMESITGFKGRFQILQESPKIIADVSHNKEGLKILFDQIEALEPKGIHLIFGTVKDKDLAPIFELFPKKAVCSWTQSSVPRSLSADELKEQARHYGLIGESYSNVNDAVEETLRGAHAADVILVTGSTFVVADIHNL